jgi:hypothetical protein
MPFDCADYNPWDGGPQRRPKTFWKETIRDVALMMVFVPSACAVSTLFGEAIDGFPPLPHTIPPPPDFPPASFLSQAGSLLLFLLLTTAFVWWLYRLFLRDMDAAL